MRKPFPNADEIRLDHIDFTRIVQPGDTVMWSQGTGEPTLLLRKLMEQRHAIGPFSIFLGGSYTDTIRPEHGDIVSMSGLGAVGTNRALCDAGLMKVIPCHLSALPHYLATGVVKIDVLLMQFGPEDVQGRPSPGAVNAYAQYALPQCRVAIAEINAAAPRTRGVDMDLGGFTSYVRTETPVIELPAAKPSAIDLAVARKVADFVDDGDIVQVGIGTIPNALLAMLGDRRRLGYHAGISGDALVPLMESGAVDNSTKTAYRGISVTGALAGTARLYDFAADNAALLLAPVAYTHAHETLRAFANLMSVNSAVEVDLLGQANSEMAGCRYVGTVGGQLDFVRGALASEGGRSIICLPSRTPKGQPRIVPAIRSGVVTLPGSDADYVVTEHGVAQLRGQPLAERMKRMIAIAHPDDREGLERHVREAY
ncbi:acetyl-CoA hydrolase/transferase family protein [Sinorhizobium fredii]|uniref:acetyl-CoA hydrolase/transferase family protein n=1 Tax=Rhizobium fredii TaxID=380 RepID=UPI0005955D4C|nr:acetyl-CoA hydrolase/transferase C-terminal domain-containing protein [Sinorhizobium fredii]WOS65497.1 acetyl-CoA hydrolase/transferase C-terminal domain-containing protein [Sinorhizobium fredii GR64]